CEPSCRRLERFRSLDAFARNSSLPSRSDTLITRTSSMASFSSSDMCIKTSWRRVLFHGSVASKWSPKRFLRVVFIQSSTYSSVIGFPGPGEDVDVRDLHCYCPLRGFSHREQLYVTRVGILVAARSSSLVQT